MVRRNRGTTTPVRAARDAAADVLVAAGCGDHTGRTLVPPVLSLSDVVARVAVHDQSRSPGGARPVETDGEGRPARRGHGEGAGPRPGQARGEPQEDLTEGTSGERRTRTQVETLAEVRAVQARDGGGGDGQGGGAGVMNVAGTTVADPPGVVSGHQRYFGEKRGAAEDGSATRTSPNRAAGPFSQCCS